MKAKTAGNSPKGKCGRSGARFSGIRKKPRKGVKERAAKSGVLATGGRRTLRAQGGDVDLDDERAWMDDFR